MKSMFGVLSEEEADEWERRINESCEQIDDNDEAL